MAERKEDWVLTNLGLQKRCESTIAFWKSAIVQRLHWFSGEPTVTDNATSNGIIEGWQSATQRDSGKCALLRVEDAQAICRRQPTGVLNARGPDKAESTVTTRLLSAREQEVFTAKERRTRRNASRWCHCGRVKKGRAHRHHAAVIGARARSFHRQGAKNAKKRFALVSLRASEKRQSAPSPCGGYRRP
jgi:hypothetical protein